MATRTGKVILAKGIELDKDYNNVINYTEANMVSLCTTYAVGVFNNCSFLRQGENIIDVQTSYGVALSANYIAFQNPDYSNKWFFGFIDKVEYVSNNNSRIYFTIDEYSTWCEYWDIRRCFVVREHTNNDTVGSNLVPEGIETGLYVRNGDPVYFNTHIRYVINADKAPQTGQSPDTATYYGTNVGGLPIAGGLFIFDNWTAMQNCILAYANMSGGLDHIKNVYVTNDTLIDDDDLRAGTADDDEHFYWVYKGRSTPLERTVTISAPSTVNGYTPRNNKVLTAPYQFALLSNGNGITNELDYEFFNQRNNIVIKTIGLPTIGGSLYAFPINYKGVQNNLTEGIVGGKLPTLSWSGDAFTNWLTLNAVNIRNEAISSTITTAAGVALGAITGGAGGAMVLGASLLSGAKSAAEMVQQLSEQKKVPNSFGGNVNAGDVLTASNYNGINIIKMSITSEFAQIIDGYFDLYGYKTLKTKIPNIVGRRYWNYVQIGKDESIGVTTNRPNKVSMPSTSMDIINKIFQRGVTIWHDHDSIGQYSLENSIL